MDATFQAYNDAKDTIHQKLFAWAVKTAEGWYELPEGDRPDVREYCYKSTVQCDFVNIPSYRRFVGLLAEDADYETINDVVGYESADITIARVVSMRYMVDAIEYAYYIHRATERQRGGQEGHCTN